MKISVIIPSVGVERLHSILISLDSLNNQKMLPYEVHLIVQHINQNFKDSINSVRDRLHFSLKIHESNGGTCKSRNIGIEEANGELLLFLDDDVILEEKYILNMHNKFVNDNDSFIITGYVFDVLDIITPHIRNIDDLNYLVENKGSELVSKLFDVVKNEYAISIDDLNYNKCNLHKKVWNFFKTLFLMESTKKGIILASGFRSEMPSIKNINGLKEVQWFPGNNFMIKKDLALKFKFDENMEEQFDYALSEDLELSTRISKNHKIYITSDCKIIHLRAPSSKRTQGSNRIYSTIVNHYYIASKMGRFNQLCCLWSIFGILLSRTVNVRSSKGLNEFIGALAAINYILTKIK